MWHALLCANICSDNSNVTGTPAVIEISTPALHSNCPPHCTGVEFDDLGALGQAQAVGHVAVLSRVEPLHKLRLVELLQAQVGSNVLT